MNYTNPNRDRLARRIRDWIHEQPFTQCGRWSDTCPDWPMAYEIADLVLVEQPRCEACGGSGKAKALVTTDPAERPDACSRCNGTGRARMVNVAEVVNWLSEQHGTAAVPRFLRHLDTK